MRGRSLQEVTGRLARALTSDDVVAALLDHLPAAVGAKSAAVAVIDRRGHPRAPRPRSRRRRRPRRAGPRVGDRRRARPTASRRGSSRRSGGGATPPPTSSPPAAGRWRCCRSWPTTCAGCWRCRTRGCTPSWRRSAPCSRRVGVLAARAFARGRRYDAEHQRVGGASSAPRSPPQLPEIDGLTIAARYRAGAARAAVGGDWYDVLRPRRRPRRAARGRRRGPRHGGGRGDGPAAHRVPDDRADATRARRHGAGREPAGRGHPQRHVLHGALRRRRTCPPARWTGAGPATCPPLLVRDGRAELLDEEGVPPLGVAPELAPPVHRHGAGARRS